MKNPKSAKKLKYGTFSILIAILAILIALALNLIISLLPSSALRVDLTDLKLSELSDATTNYLDELDQNVTIAHICITGEEEDTITDMLDKYSESSDKINIVKIDPAVRPSFVTKYTENTLESNSLIVISDKRAKIVDYYNMFTFALYYTDSAGNTVFQGEMSYSDFQTFYQYYSSYFGTYYSYDTLFAGESVTTSAIDYVTTDNLPKAYTVTGHGESELSSTLLSGLALDNIDISALSIISSGIPDDTDCVIINVPLTDFAESEASELEAYLNKGGNVILLTDPDHLELPNLLSIAENYGLIAESGYICESSYYLGQTYMVIPNLNVASETLGISGYSTVMPLSHPISVKENDSTDGIAYLEMFKSSENAYIVTEISDGENPGNDDLEKGRYVMGILATAEKGSSTSHIMWISSPSFLTDEINNYSTGGNYLYFISLLEKMTNKTSSLSIVSKMLVEESLVINFAQVCFWSTVFCVIIPLAFLVSGAYIYHKRRSK